MENTSKTRDLAESRAVKAMAWVCLLSIFVALYTDQRAVAEKAILDGATKLAATDAERLAELKRADQAAIRKAHELQSAVEKAVKQDPARRAFDPRAEGERFLAAHPEARPLVAAITQCIADSWPARSGRAAGFSDEQIHRWEALFLRQKGAPFYTVDWRVQPSFGDLDAGEVQGPLLKEIVGEDGFAKYEAYLDGDQSRTWAAEVYEASNSLGNSITPDQARKLVPLFSTAAETQNWVIIYLSQWAVFVQRQLSWKVTCFQSLIRIIRKPSEF